MLIKGLDYEHIGGDEYNPYGRMYRTLRDYKFFYRTTELTIPAGYQWDGPSGVPYVGNINSGWLEPSLVHDFLYEDHDRIEGLEITRQEVDEKFYTDLTANGVSVIYIFIMKKFLQGVFQNVWDGSVEGATTVLKRYMVPVILTVFGLGALVTTGLIFYAPAVLSVLAAFV